MAIPVGVTPTFTLTFSDQTLDLTAAANVYVSFKNGKFEITKTQDDLTVEARSVSVYLSQKETLSLSTGTVAIQANWTYADGSRAASSVVNYSFSENLLNRVVE